MRAQDLESTEPKFITLSFVPGYPGCHKFYVDLIMIDPFPCQMPSEILPAYTPTLRILPTRGI